MSADVWIEIAPCGHCGRSDEKGEELNVTYNLSAMLTAAGFMGGNADPRRQHGRHGGQGTLVVQ